MKYGSWMHPEYGLYASHLCKGVWFVEFTDRFEVRVESDKNDGYEITNIIYQNNQIR